MKLSISHFRAKYLKWFSRHAYIIFIFFFLYSCHSVDSLYRMKNEYLRDNEVQTFLKPYDLATLSNKPVVEYLLDSKDSLSIKYYSHYKKICDYTKIPFNFKLLSRFNSQATFESSTRVVVVRSTKGLSSSVIPTLIQFVASGGVLVLPSVNEDYRFHYLMGIKPDAPMEYDVTSKGMLIETPVLAGKTKVNLFRNTGHFAYSKSNFNDNVTVHIWSDTEHRMPVLIENQICKGKVLYFNTSKEFDKRDRGLLFATLLKGLSGIPFPLANASTIFLDDFPSPLYDVKKEPIKTEYNMNMNEYVYKVWWPDMKKLAKKHDLKYTALLAFDYDDLQRAPYSFKQWDYAKMRIGKNKNKITSNYLSLDLLKDKHELGFHGYNHISLLKEEWKQPIQIAFALKASQKKWLVNNFQEFPVSYVPPSNYIDKYGLEELKKGMPSLKFMSSLYLGELEEGGNREFDMDPFHKDLFDYPRISSGFYLKDESFYDVFSTYLYTGIWTHFVHPDDVFQIRNSVEKNKKKYLYELRNENGLYWKKKKKSLYNCFDGFLTNFKNINSQSEFYAVKEAGPKVMRWRSSNFEHIVENGIYKVQEKTSNFKGTETTWNVYFEAITPGVKQELLKQAHTSKTNDFLGGKLIQLKGKNQLAFSDIGALDVSVEVVKKCIEDYHQFEKARLSFISGSSTVFTHEDFLKKIAQEKESLLALMLKQLEIDYKIWNKYASYMSWEDKGDDVWDLLDKHCEKHPSKHNINYSFELAKILGFSDENLHKKWIKKQYKWNQEKLSVLKEYLSIIIDSNEYEEVSRILFRIFELEPTCENQEAYVRYLLLHQRKEAFLYLSKLLPATAYFNDDLVSDICWSYVNDKDDYQTAIHWAEYSALIGMDTKLSWMYELRQYVELEQLFKKYIKVHPEDDGVRQKMFQIYEALGKYDEACAVANEIKTESDLVEIKEHLNAQIVYFEPELQELLIKKYPLLFTIENKEKIQEKLKILYGDNIEAFSTISYFVKEKSNFQNYLKYVNFDRKRNSHDFAVKHKELYSLDVALPKTTSTVLEFAYDFKRKQSAKAHKFFYNYGVGVEKDLTGKLYYNGHLGININPKKTSWSLNFDYAPANFWDAYKHNIYQLQLNSYWSRNLKFIVLETYLEGNLYTKIENFSGALNMRVKKAVDSEKYFKIAPYLEGFYQFSNIDEPIRIIPVYLIKNRIYGGGGIDISLGNEFSKFKCHTSGAYYFDSFERDFINVRTNLDYRLFKYSFLKAGLDLNFQSQYNFNTFSLGFKHIF